MQNINLLCKIHEFNESSVNSKKLLNDSAKFWHKSPFLTEGRITTSSFPTGGVHGTPSGLSLCEFLCGFVPLGNFTKIPVGGVLELNPGFLMLLSPGLLRSLHDGVIHWIQSVKARNTTLFRKPSDWEDGILMSQNNYLIGVWTPDSFIESEREKRCGSKVKKGHQSYKKISWDNRWARSDHLPVSWTKAL